MPRLRPLSLTAAIAFGVIVFNASGTQLPAADHKNGPALTEPPKNDPSYNLMGEFVGEISPAEGEAKTLGLQIRALGGDAFDAISFLGGLPGQDNHQGEPMRMIGRRSEDFVVLSGGPWVIIVETDHCLLLDRKGKTVGRLERVQRQSPTLGAFPPKDAVVLFDGTNIDQFSNAQMTKEGLLTEGADIRPMFQDFNLHVEFRLPYMPHADGQSRANSGLYLQSRYECQVLDSFALDPLFNGLGALYRLRKPDLNMCFPPLVWQTYDIQFTAPRWASDGTKIRDAHITSWVNGVKVQDDVALPNKTGAGKPEEPILLPSKIQDHGNPVRFRNIWLVDRGLATGEFPVYPTEEELAAAAKAEQDRQAEAESKQRDAKNKKKAKAESKAAEAKQKKTPKEEPKKDEPKANKAANPEAANPEAAKPNANPEAAKSEAVNEKRSEERSDQSGSSTGAAVSNTTPS